MQMAQQRSAPAPKEEMQHVNTPQNAPGGENQPRRKLVDYTKSRNPNFDKGFERADEDNIKTPPHTVKERFVVENLRKVIGDFQHKVDGSVQSDGSNASRSPALPMPSFRSIDSGAFSFEEIAQESQQERIDFLFKLQPKRAKSERRLDEYLQKSNVRKPIRPRSMFSALSDTASSSCSKRYLSEPQHLASYHKKKVQHNSSMHNASWPTTTNTIHNDELESFTRKQSSQTSMRNEEWTTFPTQKDNMSHTGHPTEKRRASVKNVSWPNLPSVTSSRSARGTKCL